MSPLLMLIEHHSFATHTGIRLLTTTVDLFLAHWNLLSQWPSPNISFLLLQPLELFWVRLIPFHLQSSVPTREKPNEDKMCVGGFLEEHEG